MQRASGVATVPVVEERWDRQREIRVVKAVVDGQRARTAVLALRDHAKKTNKDQHGRSYKVHLSSRYTVNDLIDNLKQGNIMLIHGSWRIKLSTAKIDRHLSFMGGMPHTMLLVGYDPRVDSWLILDPARNPPPSLRVMKTQDLINDFW